MVLRVQQIGDEDCVVLSRKALEVLHLSDGTKVEVRAVEPMVGESPSIRTISTEEALASYRKTLPQHREAYLELAKLLPWNRAGSFWKPMRSSIFMQR